jgi:hypothetical protein
MAETRIGIADGFLPEIVDTGIPLPRAWLREWGNACRWVLGSAGFSIANRRGPANPSVPEWTRRPGWLSPRVRRRHSALLAYEQTVRAAPLTFSVKGNNR